MTKKRLIILLIIIVGVWYFWGRDKANDEAQIVDESVPAVTSETNETNGASETSIGTGQVAAGEGQVIVHYFTKDALDACSTKTVTAAYDVNPQYGHPMASALVAMTMAPFEGFPGDYVSALLPGTRLLSVRIDKDGKAVADYNGLLNKELGECGVIQRRAQIENTLKEFAQVKDIEITVEGSNWQ